MGDVMSKRELFDETQSADYIGMSVAFLRRGRSSGVVGKRTPPPAHLKLGVTVRYAREDLDAWLDARRVDPARRLAAAARASRTA
jgi:hypothetical protein